MVMLSRPPTQARVNRNLGHKREWWMVKCLYPKRPVLTCPEKEKNIYWRYNSFEQHFDGTTFLFVIFFHFLNIGCQKWIQLVLVQFVSIGPLFEIRASTWEASLKYSTCCQPEIFIPETLNRTHPTTVSWVCLLSRCFFGRRNGVLIGLFFGRSNMHVGWEFENWSMAEGYDWFLFWFVFFWTDFFDCFFLLEFKLQNRAKFPRKNDQWSMPKTLITMEVLYWSRERKQQHFCRL